MQNSLQIMQTTQALLDFLRAHRMSEVAVAVLGDVVLDRYLFGATSRVSREAPIPVVVCGAETDNLGGAGNVAANLRGLGCRVLLSGTVGNDPGAERVRAHLQEWNIEAELLARPGPTLTKTRLLCGGQQVARFDHETVTPLTDAQMERALRFLDHAAAEGAGALILSDYGLGFCTDGLCTAAIARAKARGIPVFVDPRGSDWSKYRGADVATPNLGELAAVQGSPISNEDDSVVSAGREVRRRYGIGRLLVTRSSKGMSLLGDEPLHIPARPVEVFDVSGAGDTVIAVLAAFSAAGFDMEPAARMANEAAQFVVTRSGTYPVSAQELLDDCAREARQTSPIVGASEATTMVRVWQGEGLRVVFTNGCFDVLHAGHLDSLRRARALGDRLVVGLNSDRSVRALKGPSRPVNTEGNRALLLAALRPVDLVVVFDEDTPAALLSGLRPDVLAKGGDYRAEDLPGREFVGEVVILPLVEGLSTTGTLERGAPPGSMGKRTVTPDLVLKRAYDATDPSDGCRVLVDRLWPRGVSKEALKVERWWKEIAPSTQLRQEFAHKEDRFAEFAEHYRGELNANPMGSEFLGWIRERLSEGRVSLIYAAKDTAHNQAVVLRGWILERL